MSEKVIITAALTGAIHTPTMSQSLPITPDEIAEEARRASEAGATVVHVHARDPETGQPSADSNLFGEILAKIKSKCDAVICTTTGGGFVDTDGVFTASAVGSWSISAAVTMPQAKVTVTAAVTVLPLPDTDSDGDKLPDVWELDYGFDPADPTDAVGDADSDGANDGGGYLSQGQYLRRRHRSSGGSTADRYGLPETQSIPEINIRKRCLGGSGQWISRRHG